MFDEYLESRVEAHDRSLGFTLVGIAPATETDGFERFEAWLDAGYAGERAYLHKHRDKRDCGGKSFRND